MAVGIHIEADHRTPDVVNLGERPFLARVRLRAQRRVLWMRAVWSGDSPAGEQGLAISHAEVDRILSDPAQMTTTEPLFYESDPVACHLTEQIRQVEEQTAHDPAWTWLRQHFGLCNYEVDLLSLAVAPEVDPQLRRVYGYLHDDATAGFATPWLAAGLFQWPSGVAFGSQCALVRWLIARPLEATNNPWAANAPWLADPHIVLWITNGLCCDPALGAAMHLVAVGESQEKVCLYPAQLAAMQEFVRSVRTKSGTGLRETSATPIEINLIGANGAGKRTLAGQFSAALGGDLACADASILLGPDVPLSLAVERVIRATRTARLAGGILYWHDADGVHPRVWQVASGYSSLTLFGSQIALPSFTATLAARQSVRLLSLTRSSRIALWKQVTNQPVPDMIADWLLAPGEIVQAARVAPAGWEAIAEACQGNLHLGPSELFTPLACPYTWDDIVLSPALREHLTELEQQVCLRWPVYEDWGFERLCPLGRGITAMFAGPSGTGKTMAAQVLARSLGMKLYRVDLAGVMNKYIGETEKRLKQVFEACERANVLLFFDEADALFGQRTQVKDAHDRFANIEIDYLLQRMEQFEGIAILATNRKGDLDKAFLRRIRFIVDFMQPGPAERLSLWRRALQARSPEGEELLDDIDWEFLADQMNMTGADITAAALGAAFLARAEGSRITMNHILHAARREMTKHGVLLRPGDWKG
jgi:ATPase family associated with various cellular activities (AAA)